MSLADLKVIGPAAVFGRYLVSGGTAIKVGEPLVSAATLTSGVADVNTSVLLAADGPVIGTDKFMGIAVENSQNASAGTVLEQFLNTSNPIPNIGRIRGKGETAANWDTLTELALLIQDVTHFDYNSTGATDGGELYTIKTTPGTPADTAGLEIVGGNPALNEVDVTVDFRVYRHDVTT